MRLTFVAIKKWMKMNEWVRKKYAALSKTLITILDYIVWHRIVRLNCSTKPTISRRKYLRGECNERRKTICFRCWRRGEAISAVDNHLASTLVCVWVVTQIMRIGTLSAEQTICDSKTTVIEMNWRSAGLLHAGDASVAIEYSTAAADNNIRPTE